MNNTNTCEKCGGALDFDPSIMSTKCKNCGNVVVISQDQMVKTYDISMIGEVTEDYSKLDMQNVRCASCGAQCTSEDGYLSRVCKYCGSNLMIDDTNSKNFKSPDGIIHFAFDKYEAKNKFQEYLRKKKFIPSALKQNTFEYKIDSIYIPTYVFSGKSDTMYEIVIAETKHDSNGRPYETSRIESGTKSVDIKDLVVECSKYLTQTTIEAIKPFDLSKKSQFNKAFVAGYSVEHIDKSLSEARDLFRQMSNNLIRQKIKSNYPFGNIRSLRSNTDYSEVQYSYIILPTYKISYSYKNKEYSTFMNGQTGKLDMSVPKSVNKILFTMLLGLVGLAGIVALLVLL